MNVQHVYDEGLCMQCGACEGVCPAGSVSLTWDLRVGYRLAVDAQTCTDCGRCHEARSRTRLVAAAAVRAGLSVHRQAVAHTQVPRQRD